MRFLDLVVKAFGRIETLVHLPLDRQGLVLVEGRNGAGKSLLVVEAPTWVLYDKMVRHKAKAIGDRVCHPKLGAEATLRIERNGKTYSVHRHRPARGRATFEIKAESFDSAVSVSRDPSQRAEDVAEFFGIDYNAFRSAVVVASLQLATSGFALQMSIIEQILRIQELGDAAAEFVKEASAIESDLARARSVRTIREQAFDRASADLTEAESPPDDAHGAATEADLRAALKAAKDAEKKLPAARKQHETLQAKLAALDERHTKLRTRLGTLVTLKRQFETQIHTSVCATCRRPFGTEKEAAEIRTRALAEISKIDQETVETNALMRQDARAQIVRDVDAAAYEVIKLTAAVNRRKDVETAIAALDREAEEREARVQQARTRLAEAETALKDATASVLALERSHWFRSFWASGFGRDQLQADAVSKALPVLNTAAKTFSARLSDEHTVEFNPVRTSRIEDLVRIHSRTDDAYVTYDDLSGGEKQCVDLILAFSLRELARVRLPEPINLSVFDETFDKIDPEKMKTVVGLLQEEAERGHTVIVVTHSPTLKDLFPSAKLLSVEKVGGASRVRYGAT